MTEEFENQDEKSTEEMNQAFLQMIQESIKNIDRSKEATETVLHLKLINGQEVIGIHYSEDKKQVVLKKPMKININGRPDATTILSLELWSPFDIHELTSFLWHHIISAAVVDRILSEYYHNMWLYQSMMIKPQNMGVIANLNLQMAASLSPGNLKFLELIKANRGKIPDTFPDTLQ